MCYTSGTTGRPKGVTYSHRSPCCTASAPPCRTRSGVSSRDTVLPVVPMFHANAWGLPYAAAFSGAEPRLPRSASRRRERPRPARGRAGDPDRRRADGVDGDPGGARRRARPLGPLRAAHDGGRGRGRAAVDDRGLRRARPRRPPGMGDDRDQPARHGLPPLAGAEQSSGEQYAYRARQGVAGAAGRDPGRDNEDGEIPWDDEAMGELEVRGPWVAAGYHGGEGDEKFTEDGWFAHRRRGHHRPAGLHQDLRPLQGPGQVGRRVDQLGRHGEPADGAPGGRRGGGDRRSRRALGGAPPRGGRAGARARRRGAEELREHLSADFAKWQLPERFEFVEAIPRTATGKWKKTELRSVRRQQLKSAAPSFAGKPPP